MRFRINGVQIGYISDNLLDKYRELYEIGPKKKNFEILKDLMFKYIIEDKFSPDTIDRDIDMAYEISTYHEFENTGDYLQYILHSLIEEKIMTCKKCRYLSGNYCNREDIYVYKNHDYCSIKPEITKEDEELLSTILADKERREKENGSIF